MVLRAGRPDTSLLPKSAGAKGQPSELGVDRFLEIEEDQPPGSTTREPSKKFQSEGQEQGEGQDLSRGQIWNEDG